MSFTEVASLFLLGIRKNYASNILKRKNYDPKYIFIKRLTSYKCAAPTGRNAIIFACDTLDLCFLFLPTEKVSLTKKKIDYSIQLSRVLIPS